MMGEILYQSELSDVYGEPEDGADYLKVMSFKEFADAFAHVKDFEGNKWGLRIYGHEALEAPLREAFHNIVDRGFASDLRTYDGCFNIRAMKGGSHYSVHSWGLAVDFNAGSNPFGGPVRFSKAFLRCFADASFECGAAWHTPDGMHFQLPWTQDWRQSENPLAPKEPK